MEWTRTEDELPYPDDIVICADELSGFVTLGKYDADEDCFMYMSIHEVDNDTYPTHWMPLPELPKDK